MPEVADQSNADSHGQWPLHCEHEPDGRYRSVSEGLSELLGHAAADWIGRSPYDFIHPHDAERVREFAHRAVLGGAAIASVIYRLRALDGGYRWVETRADPVIDAEHGVVGIRTWSRAAAQRLEDDYLQLREIGHAALHVISEGVLTCNDQGLVDYLNPAAEQLTGWPLASALGQDLGQVFAALPSTGEGSLATRFERWQRLAHRPVPLLCAEGKVRTVEFSLSALHHGEALAGVVVIFRDMTERQGLVRELERLARHDSLTGALNRVGFEARLSERLASAQAGGQYVLACVDLDNVGGVNEALGNAAGDEFLRLVAREIRHSMTEGEELGRVHSDEFAWLMRVGDPDSALLRAEQLCHRIRDRSFAWGAATVRASVSVGMVVPDPDADPTEALSHAHAACLLAKSLGGHRAHLLRRGDPALQQREAGRRWLMRLRAALDTDGFLLFAQDIVPTREPEAPSRAFEVLLALPDSLGGVVRPGVFLDAAARFGLMPEIDLWVARTVIERLKQRERRRLKPLKRVAINLSGQSIGDEEFGAELGALLREIANPEQLTFELTESEAISNLGEAQRFIRNIRLAGAKLALDDFGSGLSSFGYLKALPVDYLKIDGQFVRDAARDPIDAAFVESIHRLARVMGLHTIAEYVESAEVLAKMAEIGVHYCQGYHLGRPRPLAQMLARYEEG